MYTFFNIMVMSSSHEGNAWPSCSWTNIITTYLVIWFMNALWTTSWTTTAVSSDICESVILDFACRLEFVVSKSQGQATLDFTSDPQLTKNASWPRNQSFTMTWAPLTSYRRNFAIPSRPQIFQHHCSWSDISWAGTSYPSFSILAHEVNTSWRSAQFQP